MSAKGERVGEYLQDMLDRRGISASQLAAYLDVSHVTVGRWLKGTDIPSSASCRKIAFYFHVPEDTLLGIAGHRTEKAATAPPLTFDELMQLIAQERPIGIPVYDQIIHAGEGAVPADHVYLPPRVAKGRRLAAAPVRGDCMQPTINEGDMVVIDLEASPNINDVVVVLVNHEDVAVKRLVGRKNGAVILACDNPAYPQEEVEDAQFRGVVIQVTRQLRG